MSPIAVLSESKPKSVEPSTVAEADATAPALSPADLAELMSSFNDVTRKLEATHESLRAQVARLQGELREATRRLRRSERLASLGEMAAGIAHEIRNPLGSIKLYATMLVSDLPDRPAEQATAAKIDKAVRGLDAIVGDVLTFSRQIVVRPMETTASDLFDEAIEHCRAGFARSNIEVVREDHNAPPVRVVCDPGLMRQALVNVIRNATEAIDEACAAHGGEARISLGATDATTRDVAGRAMRMASLSVRDTGLGVSEAVIGRMFNPFFTTRHTGTGLGLAMVHRIVDAHGGAINVRNQPVCGHTGLATSALTGEARCAGGAILELLLPAEPTTAPVNVEDSGE